MTRQLETKFDHIRFFERQIPTAVDPHFPVIVKFNVVVAFSEGGAFPGSRVAALKEDAEEHSMIEAWRHLIIFKGRSAVAPSDLVHGRIRHFGIHGDQAHAAIDRANRSDWPKPSLRLIKSIPVDIGGGAQVYLARALCADYRGWHEGDSQRFVY